MNSDYEKRLDIKISGVLKDLPDLAAPDSLVHQVMIQLEQRSTTIWYRRSWQTWPWGLRVTSLITLVTLFVGLCFAGWEFSHTGIAAAASQRAGEWFSGFSAVTNTLVVLLNSMCLVVKKLGTGFIITCFFVIGLGYVMCVGLGTVYMRLAFAKQ